VVRGAWRVVGLGGGGDGRAGVHDSPVLGQGEDEEDEEEEEEKEEEEEEERRAGPSLASCHAGNVHPSPGCKRIGCWA